MQPQITDKFGKASISTNYAVATTVKTARTSGESVLACYDLSKFAPDTPVFFVTYKKSTDPTTNEVLITNQISWKALVNPDNNTLTNLTLAPGYVDSGNAQGDFVECMPTSYWGNSLVEGILKTLNPDGTLAEPHIKASDFNEMFGDGIISGATWTYPTTGRDANRAAGVAFIDGLRVPLEATTRTFTATKDTYVRINKSTGAVSYVEAAVGAAEPAATPNAITTDKFTTDATKITAYNTFNRGVIKSENIDTPSTVIYGKAWWATASQIDGGVNAGQVVSPGADVRIGFNVNDPKNTNVEVISNGQLKVLKSGYVTVSVGLGYIDIPNTVSLLQIRARKPGAAGTYNLTPWVFLPNGNNRGINNATSTYVEAGTEISAHFTNASASATRVGAWTNREESSLTIMGTAI